MTDADHLSRILTHEEFPGGFNEIGSNSMNGNKKIRENTGFRIRTTTGLALMALIGLGLIAVFRQAFFLKIGKKNSQL